MQGLLKKNGVIRKLLISYIILLLLPVCIIWMYLFPQMQQRMIDHALLTHENNIARLSAVMDQALSLMVANSLGFAANPQLTPYSIRKGTVGEYEAVREIGKFSFSGGLVSQSFYYLKSNQRFYTSASVYPLSWLSDTSYGYCYYYWPQEEMQKDLEAIRTITVRPMEPIAYPDRLDGRVMTVMLPVPMSSRTPYAVLVLWIDYDTLAQLISPMSQDAYECTLMYDADGQRLFSMHADQIPVNQADFDELVLRETPNGAQLIEIAGQQYLYASDDRNSALWRCISLMPLGTLTAQINAVRWNVMLIISLLIAAGVIIITMAIRSHYLPIRTLATKAGQFVDHKRDANEFDVVHHALDHLNTQAETLQSRMVDNIPLMREHCLYALIGGQYHTVGEFNAAAGDADISFSFPYLCVTILRTDAKEPQDVLDYLEGMTASLPHGFEGCYLLAFNRTDILFVSASQSPQAVPVYVTDVCADVTATQRCKVQAAIGPAVKEAGEMRVAYNGASACMEHMTLMGRYGVALYEEDARQPNPSPAIPLYPMEFAVAKLDAEQIRRSVQDILASFSAGDYSTPVIHALYLHALSSLLGGLESAGVDNSPFTPWLETASEVRYDEMEHHLYHLSGLLCDAITAEQAQSDIQIEDVKRYIKEQCLQYEFSIQRVADQFHMSYSGFSHYFKRKTGMGCKQYVDEYRAQMAIEQIMNTLDPLEMIAQRVGFANAASFIRSFKKVTGRTPGSYRNL